ncbi:MAG TPA: ABC transporter permease [Candidatus Acidoferrum sp.]
MPGRIASFFRNLLRKRVVEQALDDELQSAVELLIQEKMKDGLSHSEARRQALIELGGVEQVKEKVRTIRFGRLLDTFARDVRDDLRFTFRNLRKDAWLSAAVVLTLTLAIATAAGGFGWMEATFMRARIHDPSSFVRLYSTYTLDTEHPGRPGLTALEQFESFRQNAKSIRDVVAWHRVTAPVGLDDTDENWMLLVTCNFFHLYRQDRPMLGRLLEPDDCTGAARVVVLSEPLWRDRFSSDPEIVGKRVQFNGNSVTVIGVAPSPYAGQIQGSRAWFPYTIQSYLQLGQDLRSQPGYPGLAVEGRLSLGYSRAQAAVELNLLAAAQDRLHPGRHSSVIVTDGSFLQQPGEGFLVGVGLGLTTSGLTIFVLVACFNVTALLLSRADSRRREIAIRLALGAPQSRLARTLVLETLFLASMAGIASSLLAGRLSRFLGWWIINASERPVTWPLDPDWRVFAFLGVLTLLAGIVAGLAPALESLKANLMDTLKASPAARTATGKRPWLHGLLIGGQIALSLVLLIAAALVARTEHDMLSGGPGYETRQILMVGLGLRDLHAIPQSWNSFQIRLAHNLQRLPGFESIAFTSTRPGYDNLDRVEIKIDAQTSHFVSVDEISPEYFSALGIPMLEGRGFNQTDLPCRRGPCNVIVSQEFVREYLPRGAIGTELRDAQGNPLEIVGVARDTSTALHGHTDPPIIYEPWSPTEGLYAPLIRFTGDGAAASRAASAILRQNYPGAYVNVQTIQAWIDSNIEGFARTETLNLFISGLTLVLAVIGLYGVVSFASVQRRKEYGVRIALGASRFDICKAVLRANARPVFVGLAVGEALAFAATLVAGKMIARFTLPPREPAVFLGVPVLLATVAIAAMTMPAHHAANCEPLKVLREE